MGISPRRLEGWEPALITSYERDSRGRILREIAVSEPEFSKRDLSRLLSARRARNAPRGPHGYFLSESTDPEKSSRMVVGKPIQDFYTQKINAAQKRYFKQYGDTVDPSALLWPMVPKGSPDALRP